MTRTAWGKGYRPPPRPDVPLTRAEQAQLVTRATTLLHDAWLLLVAAGRLTDAAEVSAIHQRLENRK